MTETGPGVRAEDVQTLRDTVAAAQAGDLPRAFALAEAALGEGLEHPFFFRMRALSRERQGRLEEAIADFRAALQGAPDDPAVLSALGQCLGRVGRFAEALTALEAAAARAPGFAPALADRGWVLENLGELKAARSAYERALAADPGNVRALGGLAALAARRGEAETARTHAEAALARAPGDGAATFALASVELAAGDALQAERRLRGLLADPRTPAHDRGVALSRLGDALDAQDRAPEAFGAWSQANQVLRTLHRPLVERGAIEPASRLAARLDRDFRAVPAAAWRAGPAPEAPCRGHVFLVGFPRSGTTLLGQVLAAHPQVVTLDEGEFLAASAGGLLAGPEPLGRLAGLDEAGLAPLREAYWRRVRAAAPGLEGQVLVDKLPMNLLGLPLIARLFPAARVLFARRDPRDAVFSCFRRQFVISGTNWEFLELEGAARFYGAAMDLLQLYREGLPDLGLREQGYEALIADFEGETAALAGFLGLEPTPAMRDFAEGARGRDIATPSAGQVARGLYAEGVGQWRRYEAQLSPALPLLDPWVRRFGYAG